MAEPKIFQRAPFVLKEAAGTRHFCTCGHSKGQPFCDGSHKGTGFTPKTVEITQEGKVAWCGCKHSKNGAFCDGSHKQL